MDTTRIPAPHLEGDAANAAKRLLEKVLAWRSSREDEALDRQVTDAEAKLRRGPNLRPGEILDRRFVLLEARPPSSLAGRWRGWDLDTSTEVGVRVLHPQYLTDPILYDRFVAGPALQRKAAGPDVAAVVTSDVEWAGFTYAVLAESTPTLASRIGQVPVDQRAPLLLEIVEAVERMHRQGLVHGALAPESVLVLADGAVALTDVGMYGGAAIGLYAAPECATPTTLANAATDAYLLGLLALTVLRDAALPYWVTRDPTEVLAEIAAEELRTVLGQMIHWKAEQRPPAAELARVLKGDVHQQVQLARAAATQGRHALAVSRFRGVVAARPMDRVLRREFSRVLEAAGNPAESAAALSEALLLSGPEDGDLREDFAELRALCARTGDTGPYLATLQALSSDGVPSRDIALFELARFHGDRIADWERALDVHQTREQAREALSRLFELSVATGEHRRAVRWGRELHATLVDPAEAATLSFTLGHLFLDRLSDPDNGLLWLDRALSGGHPDAELPATVRQLRTDRGEWAQTVELLVKESDRASDETVRVERLRAATDVARWALGDLERAAALDARLLEIGPDDDTLRHTARRALVEGKRETAARALASLAAPRAEDACRCVDAWIGAQRQDEALARLRAARQTWPDHVGLMQRALVLGLQSDDDVLAREAAVVLVDRVGPGASGRREALLVIADHERRSAHLLEAARRYQQVLVDDEQDSAAWWGLVQVAWVAGRTEAEPAWLRAAPKRLPSQEALARLMGGLLDPSAVVAFLVECDGEVETDTSRLERAGTVVERLLQHGLVDATLFDELAALAGEEESGWVEAVRRLWYGSSRADVAFPLAAAHRWCPVDGPDYFRRSHRVPLGGVTAGPTRAPGRLAEPEVRATLLVRSSERSHLSLEGEAPMAVAATRRPAIVSDGAVILVTGQVVVGTRPDAHLVLSAGPEVRCRFEASGDRVYVTAETPVEVAGRPTTEARLEDGAVVVVDGHPLRFLADLPSDAPIPALPASMEDEAATLPGLTVDEYDPFREEQTESAQDQDPIRAALFYRQDGAERILPLTGERVVIGPAPDADLRVGEGSGWLARIDHPGLGIYQIEVQGVSGPGGPGQPKLLTQGEQFTAGGIDFEFQVVEASTPAPPPPREPSEFQRGDRIPTLFYDDGDTPKSITITRDTFTIGRGRRNDLQLANDGKLSRHHATLVVGPLGVRVRDNNSSNGTTVNGELVDERLLGDGDRIGIGDTTLEFRWALTRPIAPMLVEDTNDPLSDDGMGTYIDSTANRLAKRTTSVTVSDGRTKLQAANEALSVIALALDKAGGAGNGRATLQLVVDATPKRFAPLFTGVEARSTGLPEMVVLYNLAQRPEGAQRTLLNEALLDLVERAVSQVVDSVPPEDADRLLEDLAQSRYREHLRL